MGFRGLDSLLGESFSNTHPSHTPLFFSRAVPSSAPDLTIQITIKGIYVVQFNIQAGSSAEKVSLIFDILR